ncbi:hypothetical protein KMZ68_12405 [Bradyrhizobium sediminis]|uniref:Uncharacterized protein n=1 Tax=Bradyrhizobium sediminis TaxID=2840469 RepID=A0A975RUV6_9BRAD|nr:hypothetical protein [Bradyrhizobium sediminis]QWG20564.1 hypothetical protein KMZ68_12405 [Bradyrhizobium sediminis]
MQTTLKPRESDPHDDFAIAPDVVPAAWADKVLADITGDTVSPLLDRQPQSESGAAAATPAPTVDTTFRATDTAGRPSTRRWAATAAWTFMFALCSGLAVAAWQHYGDAAGQMISNWTPPFAASSSPPPEQTALAEPADTPAVQAPAADQTAPQALAPAQPAESAAPAAAALAADTAQLQAMARDVAAMGQEIEQLKASIDQLKASQRASDVAKTSATQTPATRTSATRTPERNVRPKTPPPPPPLRSAAAPSRPPMPAYPSAPAAAAPLPQAAAPVAPPPPAAASTDEPVLRPPMPLR